MTDRFESGAGLLNPATGGFAVTPDDNTDLTEVPRALYVGGAGNLAVTMHDGSSLTFNSVPAGTLLPIRASRVLEASTATNIVAVI